MRKNLLFLGGAEYQLPAIRQAVKRGYRVTVCGNRPGDPGNRLGHEYRNVSIADIDKIAEVAADIKADIILGYVSETAVNTAARVSEKLGLPGCPVNILEILTFKDRFRNFQKKEGFTYPRYTVMTGKEPVLLPEYLSFPLVVKPSDSCGSRGVSKINHREQFIKASRLAFSFSSNKRIIIEEVVDPQNGQVTGDGFMEDGKLRFLCLGDHIYNNERATVAVGTSWPLADGTPVISKIKTVLEAHLLGAGYRDGPVNTDIRIGEDGRVYVIEAAPRFGANYVPQIVEHCTGVDLLQALFNRFEGIESDFSIKANRHALSLILHSKKEGVFKGLTFAPIIENNIFKKDIFATPDTDVYPFRNLGDAVGVLILFVNTRAELDRQLSKVKNLVKVNVE